ncbi:ATP binding [Cladochytrium tenue]|nr:ATP binding [Cladochytrium tenue]
MAKSQDQLLAAAAATSVTTTPSPSALAASPATAQPVPGRRSFFNFRKQVSPTSPDTPRSQLSASSRPPPLPQTSPLDRYFAANPHLLQQQQQQQQQSSHILLLDSAPPAVHGAKERIFRRSRSQGDSYALSKVYSSAPADLNDLLTGGSYEDWLGKIEDFPPLSEPLQSPQAQVYEKCIKVHSFRGRSHMINISSYKDGRSIRDAIYRKFGLLPEEASDFAVCRLNEAGHLDINSDLSDAELLEVASSSQHRLKAFLFLKRLSDNNSAQQAELALRSAYDRGGAGLLTNVHPSTGMQLENSKPPPAHVSFKAGFPGVHVDAFDDSARRLSAASSQVSSWGSPGAFGDRPSSQVIAEHITEYFPDLKDKTDSESDDFGGPYGGIMSPSSSGTPPATLAGLLRDNLIRKHSHVHRRRSSVGPVRHSTRKRKAQLNDMGADLSSSSSSLESRGPFSAEPVDYVPKDWFARISHIGSGFFMTCDIQPDHEASNRRASLIPMRASRQTLDDSAADREVAVKSRLLYETDAQEVADLLERRRPPSEASGPSQPDDDGPEPPNDTDINDDIWSIIGGDSPESGSQTPASAQSRKSALLTLAYNGYVPRPPSSDRRPSPHLYSIAALGPSRRPSTRSALSAVSTTSELGTPTDDGAVAVFSPSGSFADVPHLRAPPRRAQQLAEDGMPVSRRSSAQLSSVSLSSGAGGDALALPLQPLSWIRGKMIGMGSYAKVFYGVNTRTNEVMAVKQVELLPVYKHRNEPDLARRRNKMVEALKMEVLLLRELDHENIVKYLDFEMVGLTVSLFLEYVDGGSVASMLARYGKFSEPVVRNIAIQVLTGLEYLHQHCIIHRDIKGANILVNSSGIAKISDFGISKKNEYNMAYNNNVRMSLQGSVYWMAPEVVKDKGYSAKIDIWSLGCVTLEMLTGVHPWSDFNEMQTMWNLGKDSAPPLPDSLSHSARIFLGRCFIVEPEHRPTAQDLLYMSAFADIAMEDIDLRAAMEEMERRRAEAAAASSSASSSDVSSSDSEDDEGTAKLGPAPFPPAVAAQEAVAKARKLGTTTASIATATGATASSSITAVAPSSSAGLVTPVSSSLPAAQFNVPQRSYYGELGPDGRYVWPPGDNKRVAVAAATSASTTAQKPKLASSPVVAPTPTSSQASASSPAETTLRSRGPSAPTPRATTTFAHQNLPPPAFGPAAAALDKPTSQQTVGSAPLVVAATARTPPATVDIVAATAAAPPTSALKPGHSRQLSSSSSVSSSSTSNSSPMAAAAAAASISAPSSSPTNIASSTFPATTTVPRAPSPSTSGTGAAVADNAAAASAIHQQQHQQQKQGHVRHASTGHHTHHHHPSQQHQQQQQQQQSSAADAILALFVTAPPPSPAWKLGRPMS